MKTFRMVAVGAVALGLMLGAGTVKIASAQGGVNLDDPAQATEIDGSPHTIPGKSALWFRFDYNPFDEDGNHISKAIALVNAKDRGVRFDVWTPDHVNDWWDGNKPVGQGTISNVTCDSNQPSDAGPCQSSDLTWIGGFNRGATYYVRVFNDNDQPAVFTLTIN